MRRHDLYWLICLLGVLVVLGGCAINRTFTPDVHKVRKGESLSSIARDYGLDWHDLARWNDIASPYTIYVGQRLSLTPFPPLDYDHMREQRRAARAEQHPDTRSTVTKIPDRQGPRITRVPDDAGTPEVRQNDENADQEATASEQVAADDGATEATAAQTDDRTSQVNGDGWRWPLATGILTEHERESYRHGINLYGPVGTPVYTARAGQVVYSGEGLQGFGQLVILKHADEYLSAYSYVRNTTVEEGERVAVGEQIADMGVGPGDRAALHFEIRHKGEPIDPATVLPAR